MKKRAPVQYELRKSKKRKTVSIQVKPSGAVVVAAPLWVRTRDIERIVEEKLSWIKKHQRANAETYRPPVYRTFEHGSTMPVLGREVPLVIDEGHRGKPVFEVDDQIIRMRPIPLDQRPKELRACYRSIGMRYIDKQLPRLLMAIAGHVDVPRSPKEVTLRSMRRRWGSCSSCGKIRLSLRLFGAPTNLIDYVIIHELVHLYHPHHRRSFYELLECIKPDWKEASRQLTQHSRYLMIDHPLDH